MDLGKLPKRPAFENLPRRWVAERTFVWISSHNRRMAKDHERLCSTGEAFIHVAMARLMARRLARAENFQTVSPRTPVNRGEKKDRSIVLRPFFLRRLPFLALGGERPRLLLVAHRRRVLVQSVAG